MKHSFVAAFLFLLAGAVTAQPCPTQSVRLVVPFAPGGGVDTMARILAQPLAQRLGQSVAVDNRGGAGGNIGTEVAARSKPDLIRNLSQHAHPLMPFFDSGLVFATSTMRLAMRLRRSNR